MTFTLVLLPARAQEEGSDSKKGEHALLRAARAGNVTEIKRVLKKHKVSVKHKDRSGNTILHLGARRGSMAVTRYALKKGLAVNSRNRAGNTALHMAARRSNRRLINFLLSNGANLNQRNYQNDNAFHMAALSGNLKLARYLIRRGTRTRIIKPESLKPALEMTVKRTQSFLANPAVVGENFEDTSIEKNLAKSLRDGDILMPDDKCPMRKVKDLGKQVFVILDCTVKEAEVSGKKLNFGVRIRYSTQWSKSDRTSQQVAEQLRRMPEGVLFSGVVRVVKAGYQKPYLYDIYRTNQDKVIVEGRIYSISALKGQKKKK